VQVYPYEVVLKPAETARFTARLFDAKGRFIREEKSPAWALDGIEGGVKDGVYTAPASGSDAGAVTATVGQLSGRARVRVVQPLPWSYDFDQAAGEAPPEHWLNTQNKLFVRDLEGNKGLIRVPDTTPQRRTRVYLGPSSMTNYTVESDVRVSEARRQMSDAGLFNQRYGLVLFGNAQRLELQPWQAAPGRTVLVPFAWKPNAWYRMKLRVQMPDGVTLAQGKVWPRAEAEPDGWTVEKRDKLGHHRGSPGLYADANTQVYFDNLKVTANQ
jgi:hypothetical protein